MTLCCISSFKFLGLIIPITNLLCLLLVSACRRNEFGIGVELNDAGRKLMQSSQERLGRSLERLSTELYSKDTHFVLELIQVASTRYRPDAALA